ncbi:MAG: 30S ribosomal protein S16 [Urechidicola sp.]|jgi:small subunit ribosomal protein S16
MSVKIRLQRHGKKGKPFYWIVAADARSKRDGKFLEKLGTYNPNTNPATIELDIEGSVKWLQNGAQPTDTAKGLLSYKGVMLKHHLSGGVRKGAFSEEEAEKKFQAWLDEKAGLVTAKVDGLAKAEADVKAKALDAEKEVNEARKAAVVEAEEALKVLQAQAVAEVAAANAVEEVEEVVAEVAEETTTEVAAETAPEVAADESTEEKTAE